MKRVPALILVVLATLPSTVAAQPLPFEGRWSENLAWCSRPRQSGDERPVIFTRRRFAFPTSGCDIRRITRQRPRYRLDPLCEEEGEEARYPHVSYLTVKGNRLIMEWDGNTSTFLRCP